MIEEAWKDYEAKVVPASAPPIQRVESRRAFYAGAAALLGIQLSVLGSGREPTEADLAAMDRIKAELDAFAKATAEEAQQPPRFEVTPRRPNLPPLDTACNRTGCGKPTTWQVALVFFAEGYTKAHQGIRAEFGIALCDACGKTAKPEDFLTDEGWGRICEAVTGVGKLPPKRALTKIELLPIFTGRA